MESLNDFPFLHSKDFKLTKPLSDEQLQDLCSSIKTRMNGLISEKPKVSVVFPAFNEEMYLPLMLWTLSKLTTNHSIEIIGVNNASTDRTGEIIEQSGVTRIDENQKGVSYARQAGLEAAKGEIVGTTDSDTQMPSNWIDANLCYFESDLNLKCFSGGVYFTKPHYSYHLAHLGYSAIKRILAIKGDITSIQSWPGSNSFYSRASAISVGGYELGSDVGEDNKIARSIRNSGKIRRVDDDASIRVESSSRRLGSFGRVLQHTYDRITRLGLNYEKIKSGMTFSDVR